MKWEKIKEYNYEISDTGLVRNVSTGQVLKPYTSGDGRYRAVSLCKDGAAKTFRVARLVAGAFIENSDNKPCVDHINKDRLNNNVSNLRWCSYAENNRNTLGQAHTSSKYKGVSWSIRKRKWEAGICVNYKKHYLGQFNSEISAAKAYNKFVRSINSSFSYLNPV